MLVLITDSVIRLEINAESGAVQVPVVKVMNCCGIEDMLKKFLEFALTEGRSFNSVEVRALDCPSIPPLSLYIAISHAIMLFLTGISSRKESLSIARSEIVIDRILGIASDIEEALRFSTALQSTIAYRHGEGYIDLGVNLKPKITLNMCQSLPNIYGDIIPLVDILTKFAGMIVIEASNAIKFGDVEVINRLFDYDNALWYLIYGLRPPENYLSKWIPDFKKACMITIREWG